MWFVPLAPSGLEPYPAGPRSLSSKNGNPDGAGAGVSFAGAPGKSFAGAREKLRAFAPGPAPPGGACCSCWASGSGSRLPIGRPRLTSMIARRNWPASAGRSSGSRLVARDTSASRDSGRPGTTLDGAGTTSLTCLWATTSGLSPVCGWLPVSISNSITPVAYTSVRASEALCDTCSGARYAAVPMSIPVLVWLTAEAARASPKSATFTVLPSPSRTFSGLTSRWTIPAWCAAARPARTPLVMSSASREASLPRSRSSSRSVRPGTYSMTR